MNYYTGIGSRETPTDICSKMTDLAFALSKLDWCLRSGGAEGADIAFELGADNKEIYLPWDGFNNKWTKNQGYYVPVFNQWFVEEYHPDMHRLSAGGLKLMSRNTYQVLGQDLKTPSKVVFCWTKDGKASGGTGQALRIAMDKGVPIVNLRNVGSLDRWLDENNVVI